jgi:hypothetical protein
MERTPTSSRSFSRNHPFEGIRRNSWTLSPASAETSQPQFFKFSF